MQASVIWVKRKVVGCFCLAPKNKEASDLPATGWPEARTPVARCGRSVWLANWPIHLAERSGVAHPVGAPHRVKLCKTVTSRVPALALGVEIVNAKGMELRKITDGCPDEECPNVYLSDRGTVVFQGDPVTSANGLTLGNGEQAVELPLEVVRQALPELNQGA